MVYDLLNTVFILCNSAEYFTSSFIESCSPITSTFCYQIL